MLDVRIKKAIRELTGRKSRTLLTWLGLSLGLAGFGSAAVAYLWLRNDLTANFLLTNPPNINIDFETRHPGQRQRLASVAGVGEVELRNRFSARMEIREGRWLPVLISVVEDFENQKAAKIFREKGAWPPPEGTALIERSGAAFLGLGQAPFEVGHRGRQDGQARSHPAAFQIQFGDGTKTYTHVSGLVFDPGMAPSTMERVLYAYITPDTAASWGLTPVGANYLVTVAEQRLSTEHSWEVARKVRRCLNTAELGEYRLWVPNAGEHPHQFQLRSILVLFSSLGLIAFFLCAVLVVNLVNAILANQIRQIGVIKAMGATRIQVVSLYLLAMTLLGSLTAAVALPVSCYAGRYFAEMVARLLNFNLLTTSLPAMFYLFLAAVGMMLPVLAGLWPIWKAANHSVGESLRDDGTVVLPAGRSHAGLTCLPMMLSLAVRNLFRRRLRLGLTVITLAVGLVVFMAAMNVRSSLVQTSETVAGTKNYDVRISFRDGAEENRLRAWLGEFEAVKDLEFWGTDRIGLLNGNGEMGNPFTVCLLPRKRWALNPYVLEGRWLDDSIPSGVVVNQRFVKAHPHIRVGETYRFQIGASVLELTLIGVIKEFRGAAAYMLRDHYCAQLPDEGEVSLALVSLNAHGYGDQANFKRALETHTEDAPAKIYTIQTTMLMILIVRNHLDIIAWTLGLVALIMLVVGGLGMGSGMSVSIMERERELGVMRALGGGPGWVFRLLIVEAWLMAVLAWVVAMFVSAPVSRAISYYFGSLIVQYPFDYRGSLPGVVFALVVGVVVALLAAVLPSWKYLRAPVANSLRCS